MHAFHRTGMAVAMMLSVAPPAALAQSENATRLATAKAEVEAQAALEKAQAELTQQRIATLGLSSGATGKSDLGTDGALFEGWLLSAHAVDSAAVRIKAKLDAQRTDTGKRPIILLADDESFDLGLAATMDKRLDVISIMADRAYAGAGCGAAHTGAENFVAAALPLAGALLGAIKTDTTVTGYAGPTDARLVIAALGELKDTDAHWFIPGEQVGVPGNSAILAKWGRVLDLQGMLDACRRRFAEGASKQMVATIDTALKGIDDFAEKQIGAGDGNSPMIKAMRVEALAARDPYVLRLRIAKAGGSILQRKNLWTALGAPAIGITGGAVVSWRILDPGSGELIDSSNLLCRTALTNLGAVQRGRFGVSECGPARPVGAAS